MTSDSTTSTGIITLETALYAVAHTGKDDAQREQGEQQKALALLADAVGDKRRRNSRLLPDYCRGRTDTRPDTG